VDTADYFRGVRRFFLEINHSTGMVFDLEANDLIGLKLCDGRLTLTGRSLWDFVKLTATTRLVAIHNSIGAKKIAAPLEF
jgi:hypothetical protein